MRAEAALSFKSHWLHISGFDRGHREQEGHPETPALAFHSTGEIGDKIMRPEFCTQVKELNKRLKQISLDNRRSFSLWKDLGEREIMKCGFIKAEAVCTPVSLVTLSRSPPRPGRGPPAQPGVGCPPPLGAGRDAGAFAEGGFVLGAVGRRGCWYLITGLRSLEGKRKRKKKNPRTQTTGLC